MTASEWKRKAVHAGMGFFALTLRWLDWKVAALLALAALLFNLFVMPRVGRGIYRDGAGKRDIGIVAYPAMVLLLILLFRYELEAAAALWAMMAFGDPAATIAGKLLGGPSLPWNPGKRWSGFLAYWVLGSLAAWALWRWVSLWRVPEPAFPLELLITVLAPVVLLGAFCESIESGIDDNWIPPIPCALLLAFVYTGMLVPHRWSELPTPPWLLALAVNGSIALVVGRLRVVSISGAVAGGCAGAIILALGGWPQYAVLWGFFFLGTTATRLGFLRKQEQGTAQEGKGRRGARHVVANCGVGAFLCLLIYFGLKGVSVQLNPAYAATFAAALADTLGTEVGSLYGRKPVSLLSWRVESPGSRGAVSWPGLAAGLLGAMAIAALASVVGLVPWRLVWVISVAGIAGSVAESLLSDLGRIRGFTIEHEFANAFNTFVGAVVALELVTIGRFGFSLPFDWRGI
jgi:uncharacterized protein (TIGR00297 family)